MSVRDDLLDQAIVRLSSVQGVLMDPDALAEDVFLLSVSFSDEEEFLAAVLATQRALSRLLRGSVDSSNLTGNLSSWRSYHYQHRVFQGAKADMRIEWQSKDGSLYVRGFGHRWIPSDFYKRLSETR